jgi:hypothetical protein
MNTFWSELMVQKVFGVLVDGTTLTICQEHDRDSFFHLWTTFAIFEQSLILEKLEDLLRRSTIHGNIPTS